MRVIEDTCPGCGAPLKQVPGSRTIVCEYCGTRLTADPEPAPQPKPQPQPQVRSRVSRPGKNDGWAEAQAQADRKRYKRVRLAWVILIVAGIAFDMTDLAASALLFGLIYIIGGRPREAHYAGVFTAPERENRIRQVRIWRGCLLGLSAVEILLWADDMSTATDAAMGIMIIGLILTAVLRPWRKS